VWILSASNFGLLAVGTYQVSVTEAGQLVIALNGLPQMYTLVGRFTGSSQLVGLCLVRTLIGASILSIRNPAGNPTALTITPVAGCPSSVSAHLVITRLT